MNATGDGRAELHGMWSSVAEAWDAHAAFVCARGEVVTRAMLESTAPGPGDHVLELAAGTGGPGLAAAALVGPGGSVVQSDVSAEMAEHAARRARTLGLSGVQTRVLDLERIDEPDGSYDVVLCREGLMLVPDPARALREIRRVLRPGGRLALTVWGPPARNPWLRVVFDVVGAQLGAPVPPAGIPHPFSLADADRLAALLAGAGLVECVIDEIATPFRAGSADEWWDHTTALAGPLARRLAALPPAPRAAIRRRAHAEIDRYRTPAGLEIPGLSLLATARVPAG